MRHSSFESLSVRSWKLLEGPWGVTICTVIHSINQSINWIVYSDQKAHHNLSTELLIYLPFRSVSQYWALLTALKQQQQKEKENTSDWNNRKVIKVLINVWNYIFKSSQWIGQCHIPWEFVPFCNCPWVERILVVIPNGCWLCVRVQYSMERVEYEWPADCSFASSWETSLYRILYSMVWIGVIWFAYFLASSISDWKHFGYTIFAVEAIKQFLSIYKTTVRIYLYPMKGGKNYDYYH